MNKVQLPAIILMATCLAGCSTFNSESEENKSKVVLDTTTEISIHEESPVQAATSSEEKKDTAIARVQDSLPAPSESKTKFSKVIGWPDDKTPVAPAGFEVVRFATDLQNPRNIYELPNGDVLVAEANTELGFGKKALAVISGKAKSQKLGKSANRITLLRDNNKDGIPELREVFLEGLNRPFGMVLIHSTFYVANTDGLLAFPYEKGQTKITSKGKHVIELPAGGYNNHWTRNLIANADQSKIYISVGSGSNIGEHGLENEVMRANIIEINPDGTGKRIYASGLRNPVGMDWAPATSVLWTVVNERDMLGDELVPDYLTSIKDNGFYGWPWFYWGDHKDTRLAEKPQPLKDAIVPDVNLGSHTASLGLAFYDQKSFPSKYQNGAFIGQHGSWNHSELVGYKVVFVPFKQGKPSAKPEDFLTGFIANNDKGEVYGRPVGVTVLKNGSLLVADDSGNTIWKITSK